MKYVAAAAAILALTGAAFGDIRINEILTNPPGTDGGFEFFELAGTPGQSLDGYTLLVFEGDGTNNGILDVALSLDGLTLDATNGLFLWRDAATVIDNDGSTPGTQGPGLSGTSLKIADFTPDLENGSGTFVLVTGFTGSVGTDYDSNDDQIPDSTPWTSAASAVGFIEDDGANNFSFAAFFGGDVNVQQEFSPDAYNKGADGVGYHFDTLGDAANGYFVDPLEIAPFIANAGSLYLTPGAPNVIPAPAATMVVGLGMLAGLRRRR